MINTQLLDAYQTLIGLMPYKIQKRINKTGEARSGSGIIKRRNRRSYRVITQYSTWLKVLNNQYPISLDVFEEGAIVLISPSDYFGNNYPNRSGTLSNDFILGDTGVIYYSTARELNEYPPLDEWFELVELTTQTDLAHGNGWIGEVVFDVKNANPNKISYICKNESSHTDAQLSAIRNLVTNRYPNLNVSQLPEQAGIGNYDYDYANEEVMLKVKMQMLGLLLITKTQDNNDLINYFQTNINTILHPNKDNRIRKLISKNSYFNNLTVSINNYLNLLRVDSLLDENQLSLIGAKWNNDVVCPLCKRRIFIEEFFKEIEQDDGREVLDNTQRSIVLMHIKALHSGFLNHSPYNLGWGHIFCNTIQGGKDIVETIDEIKAIIKNYTDSVNDGKN